jgi:DNA-binding XRE family transcriptional regulator
LDEDGKTWLLYDKKERVVSRFDTQAEAIEKARSLVAGQGGGSVDIHSKDGQVRETVVSESHGHELSQVIGRAVLRHRKAAGLTRSELSELSGVGATAIYQIENGHPTVRLETLVSVLDVLNIKLHLSSSLEGEIS